MRAEYRGVLDACVLIAMPLADTLLRMVEAPRLYLPKWSQLTMDDVTRNLISKWDMPAGKARRREEELRRHFPQGLGGWIRVVPSPTRAARQLLGPALDRSQQPASLLGARSVFLFSVEPEVVAEMDENPSAA